MSSLFAWDAPVREWKLGPLFSLQSGSAGVGVGLGLGLPRIKGLREA